MGRTPLRRSSRAVKRKAIAAPIVSGLAEQALLPSPPIYGDWMAADAAVVGSSHLRTNPPKPCQDAALSDARTHALVVLADGAGSAAVSHIGAAAVVVGVRRLCRTLEAEVSATLDTELEPTGAANSLAQRIVMHSIGILDDLAEQNLRGAEDFRCTLLVWIVGLRRALWLKVGDGALVAETDDGCQCVGPAGKGEFANQTCFIGPRLTYNQWFWGNVDATRLRGLAAMSDGAAERLVASDASRVSPAVEKLLRGVAETQVGRRELFNLLAEAEFWKGTSGDDKSLAMIARTASPRN
jgi:hypothetical protein